LGLDFKSSLESEFKFCESISTFVFWFIELSFDIFKLVLLMLTLHSDIIFLHCFNLTWDSSNVNWEFLILVWVSDSSFEIWISVGFNFSDFLVWSFD